MDHIKQLHLVNGTFEQIVGMAVQECLSTLHGDWAILYEFCKPLLLEELNLGILYFKENFKPVLCLSIVNKAHKTHKGKLNTYWFFVNYRSITFTQFTSLQLGKSKQQYNVYRSHLWKQLSTERKHKLLLEIRAIRGTLHFFRTKCRQLLDLTYFPTSDSYDSILRFGNQADKIVMSSW
jgi:hypothetical protein